MQPRAVTQSQLFKTMVKDKKKSQGESLEKQNLSRGLLELNPRRSDAKVGVFPVGKPDMLVAGGGVRKKQGINVV